MLPKRSEKEMLSLILSVAEKDERIRAVWLNGSRANPNAPKDKWQDFDVVYLVTDLKSFQKDPNWIRCFGELAILQLPDDNDVFLFPGEKREGVYAYLMQFYDRNRIDLTLVSLQKGEEYFLSDRMTVLLLDKDGRLPQIPPATDREYYVKKPLEGEYRACCNEFWWITANVAKGIWRRELPYAMNMLNLYLREELERMLCWKIGTEQNFSVNVGKAGKYLQQYLSGFEWQLLKKSYPSGDYQSLWEALFAMGDLFRKSAGETAAALGYSYNRDEDERVNELIREEQDDLLR